MSDWVWVNYEVIELNDVFYHAGKKWIKTEIGGKSQSREKTFKPNTKVLTNNPKYKFQVPEIPLLKQYQRTIHNH